MPRVPEIRQQRVNESALRTSGLQTTSFGGAAPIAQVGRETQKLMNVANDVLVAEKKKADNVRLMEAEQEVSKFQDDLLWNPATGFFRKQGKDVMPASNEVIEKFNQKIKDIEGQLSNREQIAAFKQVSNRWADSLNRGVHRHGFRESQKAEQALTEATITNERNNAVQNYGDAQSVTNSFVAIEEKIQNLANSRGLPKEWVEARIGAEKSQVHTRIVQQMVDDGLYNKAKLYSKQFDKQLLGQDKVTVGKLVRGASVRGESQRIADAIMLKDKSESDSLSMARKIKDADIRDAVLARVKNRFHEGRRIAKQNQEALYEEAANYIVEGKEIPLSVERALNPSQRITLAKYANNTKNDNAKWLDFIDLKDSEIGMLSKADFHAKYWVHFDRKHRGKAETMWNKAKNADPDLTNTLSFNKRAFNSFVSAGLGDPKRKKWSDSESKDFITMQEEAEQDIFELENKLGRKTTGPEQQEIFDNLVLKKVFVRRTIRDVELPVFLVPEEERGDIYVNYEDIPEKDRIKLANYLRSKQKHVSNRKIENLYGAFMSGDRERALNIIGK